MIGQYRSNSCGSEYEVFIGKVKVDGKTVTKLLCKKTKSSVESATTGEPYPISEENVKKLIRTNSWIKID